MKICPTCSTGYEDELNFCQQDGTALQTKAVGKTCPKCGKEADDGSKFCHHCGTSLHLSIDASAKQDTTSQTRSRSRVLIGVSATLCVVALLGGALLVYTGKTRELDISTFFGNILPGRKQPSEKDGSLYGRADVAQVVVAEELGFGVTDIGADDVNRRAQLMSDKIVSQLGSLSDLYRQQSQFNPSLMGRITLQLTVAQTGQVTKVEPLDSDFSDSEFKKSITTEASKWRFPETTMGDVKVNCPLLFIPPGIDVASIMKWEQSIGARATEPGVASKEISAAPSTSSSSQKTEIKPPAPPRKAPVAGSYETRRETAVYREPREDSEQVASIAAGIKVNVVAVQGEWLEIRSKVGNPPGFIRKDSATPMAGR